MRRMPLVLVVILLGLVVHACAGSEDSPSSEPTIDVSPSPSPSPSPSASPSLNVQPWTEQDVTFPFDADALHGVLTLPSGDGPYPGIVLVTGSVSTSTDLLDGTTSRALIGYAHDMVLDGYAVLRYDPRGVGQSTGDPGVETIDARAAEAIAALRFLQARPDIVSSHVGLWGASQGSWVISLAAAEHPTDVAFIISVSGAGISVADQQVWGMESQTRAAGLAEDDVAKAVLFGRLLIDWQLTDPLYRVVNESSVDELGVGPWVDFSEIVYGSGDGTAFPGLDDVIKILESVQDDPWADALFLAELYLPRLRVATPELAAALSEALSASLLSDPKDYLTRVRCPVLAFFGEDDIVQPSETSARLFEEHLTAAGNPDVTIVVMPDVGHNINWTTPGYSETLSRWLSERAPT